jgi:hypothetical protein
VLFFSTRLGPFLSFLRRGSLVLSQITVNRFLYSHGAHRQKFASHFPPPPQLAIITRPLWSKGHDRFSDIERLTGVSLPLQTTIKWNSESMNRLPNATEQNRSRETVAHRFKKFPTSK